MRDDLTRYEGESGRVLVFFQIAMLGVREGKEVIQTENGFLVDGERFRPLTDSGEPS